MKILLVSCYELGRQPFNIASPWAQLTSAGFDVSGVDTSIEHLDGAGATADLIAISVPMHTALRLGIEVARELRSQRPAAHVCFFGMYAALNAERLLSEHADSVIGGEFEEALVGLASALRDGHAAAEVEGVVTDTRGGMAAPVLRKLPFVVPKRDELPPLSRYATFFGPGADERRMVGYVEASRGCRHQCKHCPVTAVYRGRFFVVPGDVVLADAEQQIASGARHITFGDPDFFNGPKHALTIVRELHLKHPEVSFDVTIKVEHLIRHRQHVMELGRLGCAFIVSAVESLSDEVLARLDKGHTREDVFDAWNITREAGVPLRPTLVAFTPWTTLDDYIEVVDWIVNEGLVDHIEPIQLAIRLLVPPGSALMWDDGERGWLSSTIDDDALGFPWTHTDARMDALYETVSAIVEAGADAPAGEVVMAVRTAAYAAAGRVAPAVAMPTPRFVPRLSESWFCCAEPTAKQLASITSLRKTCD